MASQTHDLVVIGGGPGGYVAAIRAAQLGLNVACIEKESALGGTCLRVGCIPSKALLESSERYVEAKSSFAAHGIKVGDVQLDLGTMLKRKDQIVTTLTKGIDGLFKKNKITRYIGTGKITGAGSVLAETKEGPVEISAKHIIIATGSKPTVLSGIELSGNRVGTSTEALTYETVPRHLVVIGAGYIGLELGSVWQRLGAKVTVVEFLDRILPGMDREIADDAQKIFQKQGLEFRLKQRVLSAKAVGEKCTVELDGNEFIECDHVLVAVGRMPNTEGLGVEGLDIKRDKRGTIEVNDHFQTSVPGIYAIGDVIRGPMLAHKAEEEGVACVEFIVNGYGHVNYDAIPGVCYTHPEIASVGKTEEQLKENWIAYRKGVFPFMANGRARALGDTEGKVKILADEKTDRILGVHIIGPRAGDLIAEAAVAIAFSASAEDLFRCSHAHPTLSETLKEAALAVHGQALHI
ncbi:MAG: dihydrolipoyl dehydrogenase [Verrucomicrobia bacterium]|nr:dihydrolipoyl dehydrogenase [Verrucomicrobiota bacterium]